MNEHVKSNQEMWDALTEINAASEYYDVEGFKHGKCTLQKIEREELGDVAGKSLLHLQCHFGVDTMSWARLGAKVTGADFSQKARKRGASWAFPSCATKLTVTERPGSAAFDSSM